MITYEHTKSSVHIAARAALKGQACLDCADPARPIEAALTLDAPQANIRICLASGQRFSVDPADYAPLCRRCHMRQDRLGRHVSRGELKIDGALVHVGRVTVRGQWLHTLYRVQPNRWVDPAELGIADPHAYVNATPLAIQLEEARADRQAFNELVARAAARKRGVA
jgi:hypothetical protein